MRLERAWGPPVEVEDAWDATYELVRYPLGVRWSDPAVFPCDAHGFRVPPGLASFREAVAHAERWVACIGGSTTFGWFCPYEDAYPAALGRLLGVPAVNLGLNGLDLTGGLHLLVDLLRWDLRPSAVVFLDGINEKQGWLQAGAGDTVYRETSPHYEAIRQRLDEQPRRFGLGRRRDAWAYAAEFDPLRLVADQAAVYAGAAAVARRTCEAWSVEARFVLQPTVWDVWRSGTDRRHEYMTALYRSIRARAGDGVVELTRPDGLEPTMFLDWQHLDAAGNEAIAGAVASLL